MTSIEALPEDQAKIATAMRFLQNPQVRSSPLAQKRVFLEKKGLTSQEIDRAIDRSGTRQDVVPATAPVQSPTNQAVVSQQQMVPYGQPVPSRLTSWRDYMAIAVVVGGFSYGIYKLIQNFLMPFLRSRKEEQERLEKLDAAVQELNKSVLLTVEKLETTVTSIQGLLEQQQLKLDSLAASVVTNRAIASPSSQSNEIADVKAEITSLKGLLLNRHQFPATPQPSPIPAWQRVNPATDSTPETPRESPPQQTADQQPTGTKSDTAHILNASSEVGVTNGDLGVTNGDLGDANHNEGVVASDETLDMNIHENGTADTAEELANQMDVAQAT